MTDDIETCMACAIPLKAGDRVIDDVSGGVLHYDCCGPEREGWVKDIGTVEPLGPDDPIPQGYVWSQP